MALLALPYSASAQANDSTASKTFLIKRVAAVAGIFLAGSIGLSAFDARIARFFDDTSLSHVRAGQRLDDVFTHINETTLTVGGIVTYAIARIAGSNLIADVALHSTEAVVLASLTSQVIRGPLGRSRPSVDAHNQYDFHFLKGFDDFDYRAFPSIHSSSGFAAASVIVAETKRRNPGAVAYVAPIAFALALTPGLSRMYLGQHWASDVFAGAFMGTFTGFRVVNYAHTHRRTGIDRIFLGPDSRPVVSLSGGTLTLSWSGRF